mgnify:CR=1 FL=1
MRNRVIVLVSIACLGLTGFGLIKWDGIKQHKKYAAHNSCSSKEIEPIYRLEKLNYSDFFYDVGPRFGRTISKKALQTVSTLQDLMGNEVLDNKNKLELLSVIKVIGDRQSKIREEGQSTALTAKQIQLLKTFTYGSSFVLQAKYTQQNSESEIMETNTYTPHFTVVPEQPALYPQGKEHFLTYFKKHNKINTFNLDEKQLRPAKLYFIIDQTGRITNIRLDRSCGFKHIDEAMIKLLAEQPHKWIPSKNALGETIEEELVLSFGLVGC